MKKKITFFFFLSLFTLFAFMVLVFSGSSSIFSLKGNIYREKLIKLQTDYQHQLVELNENVNNSLGDPQFLAWLKKVLESTPMPLENAWNIAHQQTIEIVDYFLVNLVVLNARGEILYAYDRLPLDESRFYKTSFVKPEVFTIENHNTLLLTLQTEHLDSSYGAPLPEGYLLFFFDLKDLAKKVFSLQEKNFSTDRVISYRYSFIYNLNQAIQINQTSLASAVNRSFEVMSRWKKVHFRKQNLTFQGYRLHNGIHFAYLYPSNILGMPKLSMALFSMLGINVLLSLGLLVFYRERRRIRGLKETFLEETKNMFKKLFFWRKNKVLQIPSEIFESEDARASEAEIVGLMNSIKHQSADKAKVNQQVDLKVDGSSFWTKTRIKAVSMHVMKHADEFSHLQNWIPAVRTLLQKRDWFNGASTRGSGISFVLVLRETPKKWRVQEFYGSDTDTVSRFVVFKNETLNTHFLAKGKAVFVSKIKKRSLLLEKKLSPANYKKLEGLLLFAIAMKQQEKKQKGILVLG